MKLNNLCFAVALVVALVGLSPASAAPQDLGAQGLTLADTPQGSLGGYQAASLSADQAVPAGKASPADSAAADNGFSALTTKYAGAYKLALYSTPTVAKVGRLVDGSP